MAATAAARPYQVVVWGASGFTGKLVCEHLARDYQGRVRWALAGRDARKLEAVKEELVRINPAVKDVPVLVADARDAQAVGSMLAQTQVVLALAGPFSAYGNTVVEQAVAQKTHYCDITGEVPWVKANIDKYHKAAEQAGVKIVHCCGYDSIPSDMGTLLMADHCKKQLGKKLDKVYTLVSKSKGGASGGTIASGMLIASTTPAAELSQVSNNQYYLADAADKSKHGSDKPAPFLPKYLPEPAAWAGPFIMEGCNARIVQLTNALLPKGPYGTDFKYCEMVEGGQGWSGWAKAWAVSLGTAALGIGFATSLGRSLLKKVLPEPGQGPSLELQRTGFWNHKLIAVTEETGGAAPTVVTGLCGDKRDPGYWSTSRMILEAGLALALESDKIAATGECRAGGVLTPASAAGIVLLERLRAAGFTFRVDGA